MESWQQTAEFLKAELADLDATQTPSGRAGLRADDCTGGNPAGDGDTLLQPAIRLRDYFPG